MEKGRIRIKDDEFKYSNDQNLFKDAYFKTKSFDIDVYSVKVVGVYHTLILDDEVDFLIFIDEDNNREFICVTFDLEKNEVKKIIDFFDLEEGFLGRSFEEYEKRMNYVLYPEILKGKPLYKDQGLLRKMEDFTFKLFKIRKLADGDLNDDVKTYLTETSR